MGAPRLGLGSTFIAAISFAGLSFLVRASVELFVDSYDDWGWVTDDWAIAAVGTVLIIGIFIGLAVRSAINREQKEWWPKVGMIEVLWEYPVLNSVLEYQDVAGSNEAKLRLIVTPKGETAKSYDGHYIVFIEAINPVIRKRRKYEMSEKTGRVYKTDTIEFAAPAGFLNAIPVVETAN